MPGQELLNSRCFEPKRRKRGKLGNAAVRAISRVVVPMYPFCEISFRAALISFSLVSDAFVIM